MQNRNLADSVLIDVIAPVLKKDAAADSGWLSMDNAVRLFAIISLGVTDVTVDAKIEQANTAAGGSPKDVTGAAVTQFTALQGSKFKTIDLEAARLDHHAGFRWVRLTITAADGTTGANVAATIIRTARHMPPSQSANLIEAITVAG